MQTHLELYGILVNPGEEVLFREDASLHCFLKQWTQSDVCGRDTRIRDLVLHVKDCEQSSTETIPPDRWVRRALPVQRNRPLIH